LHQWCLPKVAPLVLEGLSPSLLEHYIMSLVEKEWGNEKTYAAREEQEQQSMCVVDCKEGEKQSTINIHVQCGCQVHHHHQQQQQQLVQKQKNIEQNQFSFCQCTTKQKENKTTGVERSATMQVVLTLYILYRPKSKS